MSYHAAAYPPPREYAAIRPGLETESTTSWRNAGKWVVAFGLFLLLTATFVSLTLFQVTAEGTAKQALRRSVASLTEIDVLIAIQYDDLQARAESAPPGEVIEIDGYPIVLGLTPDEVSGASQDELRDLVLARSANMMYDDGTDPLRSIEGSGDVGGFFSVAGLTDTGLGLLRDRTHDVFAILTITLAAISFVAAVVLAACCRGFGRLGAVGGVVLAAAIPLLVAGLFIRWMGNIEEDANTDYIAREFIHIGEALAWIPIRDGAALTAFGAALVLMGIAGAMWSDRRARYAR